MAVPGRPDSPQIVDDWAGGLTWLAHPEEAMQRASHALVADGVWIVDPLEAPGVHDAITELGTVEGIVLLLDRHKRDVASFADRYDVPVYVPHPLADAADELGVPVERFAGELGDTGYRSRSVVDNRFWREAALVGDKRETVVVPEALGTAPFFRAAGERVGVHPGLRLFPPRSQLGDLTPERLLVGHGLPVHDNAGPAVQDALAGSRRRAPNVYWKALMHAIR